MVLAAAGAYLTMPLWGRSAIAAGVPIPFRITDAHRVAMAALGGSVLGIAVSDPRARVEATVRYNEIDRGLYASHGFEVIGRKAYAKLSVKEQHKLCDVFVLAARAGVGTEGTGYQIARIPRLGGRDLNQLDVEDLHEGGNLTSLGQALYEAVVERNRLANYTMVPDLARTGRIVSRLAVEMDLQGYIITGAEPPDPKVLDGVLYALEETAKWGGGHATNVLGSVAGSIVGSRVFWLAAAGLITWRVLR